MNNLFLEIAKKACVMVLALMLVLMAMPVVTSASNVGVACVSAGCMHTVAIRTDECDILEPVQRSHKYQGFQRLVKPKNNISHSRGLCYAT